MSSSSASASATPTTGLYEPLQPAAHPVSPTERGAYVLLAAVIMIVITGLTICVKLQITYGSFHKLRRDDFTLIAALVFTVGWTVAIGGAVQEGLGRAARGSTSAQILSLSQYYYASNILLFLSLAASKCAIALLIITIQPNKRIGFAFYALMGFVVVWAIAAVLVAAFQCGPNRWVLGPTDTDTCIDQLSPQIAIRAIDIVTDIILAISPAFMMMKVQMSMDKRLVVALMFGLRLVTPVFTILSLISLSNYFDKPTSERPFAARYPAIWTAVTVNVSLITACLPSIKRFLTDWAAGVTAAPMLEVFELQNSSNNPTYGQSSGLRSFVRSNPRNKRSSKLDRSADMEQSRVGREEHGGNEDDTESKRGLTDGIVQTVDYRVEYEDDQNRWDGSTGSGGKI